MMKLAVIVLFGLIGVAIALHGTGAYGNNGGYGNGGGYGNNGGGGHKHHKSCTENPVVIINPNRDTFDCARVSAAGNTPQCQNCCEHFALSQLIGRNDVVGNVVGTKCNCCVRKCV
uniref:Uncharacterized protein n=1 Tax=Panagrolaimus davidi TaxID=227884 RepID=A0A914QAL5_9BILA